MMPTPRTLCLLCLSLLLTGCGVGGGLSQGSLPKSGAVPGLVQTTPGRMVFQEKDRIAYLGTYRASLYSQYDIDTIYTADYTLGGESNTLTIEQFDSNWTYGAAALFHFYRGKRLATSGTLVDVGTEGVLDSGHDGKNLYFYKGEHFFSIIYTGTNPVPDLVPLGRAIARNIGGSNLKPEGFRYLEVAGIEPGTSRVTPGPMLNATFLPPGVEAEAPGAGPRAKAFVCSYVEEDGAKKSGTDFQRYMQLEGVDYRSREITIGNQRYQVRQAELGRTLVQYIVTRRTMIGISGAESPEAGEALLQRIVLAMKR